jgi:plastocyanin
MTHRRRIFAVLVALTLPALGACGGSSGKSSAPTKAAVNGSITVVARDISFDVGKITTTAGPLTVNLENQGAMLHDFKIDGTKLLVKANGGKSATGTVTLAKGTYNFECTVPGHKQAGMKGTVVVS